VRGTQEARRPAGGGRGEGPLLEVRNLHVRFRQGGAGVRAVNGVDYTAWPGRALAIVGESGSGKTVSARAVMGLLPGTATVTGSARLRGTELLGLSEAKMRAHRGADIAMVFQDPARSLNPTMRIGAQISEAIRAHLPLSRRAARERAIELMSRVRLPMPERRFVEYPHQLSGGMRQRVMIAIALACQPKVLIADEATTALDVTTQAQIMELLLDLQAESGMALILITHDLGLAACYADEIMVMYAGRVVERAPAAELFGWSGTDGGGRRAGQHGDTGAVSRGGHAGHVRMPYTKALLDAVPRLDRPAHTPLPVVAGHPPDMSAPPAGCSFAPRCPSARGTCRSAAPPLEEHEPGHEWACWYPCGNGGSG
jgi:oligopeptide/dipeptide ABC transporter ATP-binding protein